MGKLAIQPTGVERFFAEDEIIVSKTDTRGRITYANEVFQTIAGYSEQELLGQPHSLVRHPDMPRSVFKLLWDTLEAKQEIFAYVVNLAKNGDHYWVFAHVTPTFDASGTVTGYHSNRRRPDPAQIDKVKELYATLHAEERRHADRKQGMQRASAMLGRLLTEKGIAYDEFVLSL
jgi:PAS domain S-box-containing protein